MSEPFESKPDGNEIVAPSVAYKVNEEGEYQPRVPDWLRDVAYYAGLGLSGAILIWPTEEILVRVAGAVGLVGNAFAKVYRARKSG